MTTNAKAMHLLTVFAIINIFMEHTFLKQLYAVYFKLTTQLTHISDNCKGIKTNK